MYILNFIPFPYIKIVKISNLLSAKYIGWGLFESEIPNRCYSRSLTMKNYTYFKKYGHAKFNRFILIFMNFRTLSTLISCSK